MFSFELLERSKVLECKRRVYKNSARMDRWMDGLKAESMAGAMTPLAPKNGRSDEALAS